MAQNQKQANGPAKPFSENDGEGAVKKWVWTPKLISVPSSWPYAWLWYHPHFRNNSQSLHFTHVLFTERNSENIMFVHFSFISFFDKSQNIDNNKQYKSKNGCIPVNFTAISF